MSKPRMIKILTGSVGLIVIAIWLAGFLSVSYSDSIYSMIAGKEFDLHAFEALKPGQTPDRNLLEQSVKSESTISGVSHQYFMSQQRTSESNQGFKIGIFETTREHRAVLLLNGAGIVLESKVVPDIQVKTVFDGWCFNYDLGVCTRLLFPW